MIMMRHPLRTQVAPPNFNYYFFNEDHLIFASCVAECLRRSAFSINRIRNLVLCYWHMELFLSLKSYHTACLVTKTGVPGTWTCGGDNAQVVDNTRYTERKARGYDQ